MWLKTTSEVVQLSGKGLINSFKGNLLIAGQIRNRGPGNTNGLLLEVDPFGNIITSKFLGSSDYDWLERVTM